MSVKLCLNGIVKNEAARIERMLKSVGPYVSSYVIVDTGSTDGTDVLIKTFFQERGIKGIIAYQPFINFSQARNAAIRAAETSRFAGEYLLLVDADMELQVINPNWTYEINGGPSYDMIQKGGDTAYGNRRLLHSKVKGRYIGSTHEYLDVVAAGLIEGAFFIDHADGSNRADKFERDIALLLKDIEKDPKNVRSWFYLANSYRDAGKYPEAIAAYRERVLLGGWDEERWNAQHSMALCMKELGKDDAFVANMVKAYNMRPTRAESLHELAAYYRGRGDNTASTLFSEAGLELPLPSDLLFVSTAPYGYGMREHFSITAWYDEKKRAKGFKVCDSLATDPKIPAHVREGARSNLWHYVTPLAGMDIGLVFHKLPTPPCDNYVPLNPSIAAVNGKLAAIVRTVNYNITEDGRYEIRNGDGSINDSNPIHTRNFYVEYDDSFVPTYTQELEPRLLPPKFNLVIGFEDMRLTHHPDDNSLHFSATCREQNEQGWCEQWTGEILPGVGNILGARRLGPRPPHVTHEKNWMPIASVVRPDTFMYRLGKVIDWEGETLQDHKTPYDVEHINGGTQVIPFGDSMYLACVHEAFYRDGKRYYVHRMVMFDGQFRVEMLGKPFVFFDKQIEFAAGMCLHNSKLLISFGVRDKEAWVASIPKDNIHRLF